MQDNNCDRIQCASQLVYWLSLANTVYSWHYYYSIHDGSIIFTIASLSIYNACTCILTTYIQALYNKCSRVVQTHEWLIIIFSTHHTQR